jgi:uncharacterized tellurite resistance protein B-like protein
MEKICAFAGLMAVIALVDGTMDPKELAEIRSQIRVRYRMDSELLDVLMAILAEESAKGLDRAGMLSEHAAGKSVDERVALLDVLFTVAAADQVLNAAELEELRAISASLGLSHRQYIDAKLQVRTKDE